MASPAQAIGLTFNWSFNATDNIGTGATLGTVSGTISGVHDNATTSSGLIATVLTTPDGQNQGVTFSVLYSGAITVASGSVKSAGLRFFGTSHDPSDSLLLLSNDGTYFFNSSPQYALSTDAQGTATTTFSPAATPVPFDFDPSFGVVALGAIWAGRKVIKKIKTSKKSV